MSKYEVYRLDDNYYFPSNDITFNSYGVWINDNLTPNGEGVSNKRFIPYTNIRQIVENTEENKWISFNQNT